MSALEAWKARLYNNYVSSGQAPLVSSTVPEVAFRSRAPLIQSLIKQHIPRDTTLSIVDIGCGKGSFVYFLRRAGYKNAVGIDGSAEQVAVARQLGVEGIRHEQVDNYISETDGSSIDVVLLIDLLEHLTKAELLSTLDGVYRILRPGGICIAHVPNAGGIFGMQIRYGDLTHEQAFVSRSAEQAFHTAGFHNVKCFEDIPVIHGVTSLARRLVWTMGTAPFRLLYAAETGSFTAILSQNFVITCSK